MTRKRGRRRRCKKRRIQKLPSSRIPPFIWLCDEEQASRPAARQKISKIRRVARGTVCPGAQARIYKERSHDLWGGLGYLSISMVHAISVARISIRSSKTLLFPPFEEAFTRFQDVIFRLPRETTISNFVCTSLRGPLREKSSVRFFYDRLTRQGAWKGGKDEAD